jgi:hypothetical protein
MRQWYYSRAGSLEKFGPIDAQQLKRLASTGQLTPEDLVWTDGAKGWSPARKIKGLFPDAPPPLPAAVPPMPAPVVVQVAGPVLIEKTSKRFKRIEAAGLLVLFIGIALFVAGVSMSLRNQSEIESKMTAIRAGVCTGLLGFAAFVYARIQTWWHHG